MCLLVWTLSAGCQTVLGIDQTSVSQGDAGASGGNGVFEPDLGEQCDTRGIDTAACDRDCTVPTCGDNLVNAEVDEQCDEDLDGDGLADDTAACNADCTRAACGDGQVNARFDPDGDGPATVEACDEDLDEDGVADNTATCNANCTAPACGDGFFNPAFDPPGPVAAEQCDEGADTARCDSDCTTPVCGDSHVNSNFDPDGAGPLTGEVCDTGGHSATCDADCTLPVCGDNVVNPNFDPDGAGPLTGEVCDDGNSNNNDSCLACQSARCGDGFIRTGSEICDGDGLGNGGETSSCDIDCTVALCGDGELNTTAGEQCDDENTLDGDGCSSSCQIE